MKKPSNKINPSAWITILLVIVIALLTFILIYHQHSVITPDRLTPHLILLSLSLVFLCAFAIVQSISSAMEYSYIDPMTKIHNSGWALAKGGKLHFQKRLVHYTAIFLNIKDCKFINKQVSNPCGDQVIRIYAKHLESLLKNHGFIGRFGGDNFIVFVKNDYLDKFLKELQNVYVTVNHDGEQKTLHVLARCGIAKVNQRDEYLEIINHTSIALSLAKQGTQDIVYYIDQMTEVFLHEKDVLAKYKSALARGEFVAYYQPKVNIQTRELCGAEALCRWIKQDGTIEPPMNFIPVLEHNGKILELDYFIFEKVCEDIKKWLETGFKPVRISSNFSALHLNDPAFVENILKIKNKYNIDGKYLEIEFTESSGCTNINRLQEVSTALKKEGLHISIDDFGTGFSSLSMVQDFCADIVKLDKSFLYRAIDGSEKDKTFMTDIVHMMRNQGQTVLCEGVETIEQLNFLEDIGCNFVQGFYFDAPLPLLKFEDLLVSPIYEK